MVRVFDIEVAVASFQTKEDTASMKKSFGAEIDDISSQISWLATREDVTDRFHLKNKLDKEAFEKKTNKKDHEEDLRKVN